MNSKEQKLKILQSIKIGVLKVEDLKDTGEAFNEAIGRIFIKKDGDHGYISGGSELTELEFQEYENKVEIVNKKRNLLGMIPVVYMVIT